jgi:hypothetical protein
LLLLAERHRVVVSDPLDTLALSEVESARILFKLS